MGGNCFEGVAKTAGPAKAGAYKVCVCGGAGGIGQPLSLLMTLDKNVREVSVYDLSIAMAYAGARLASSILSGLAGEPKVECAYVISTITDLPYFTSKVKFGKNGIEEVLPIGTLNAYETKRLDEAKAQLKTEIETGMNYAKTNDLNIA